VLTPSRSVSRVAGLGGIDLFCEIEGPPRPRGTLLITHGQGEHSQCYLRLKEAVRPLGLRIAVWDLRGHGQSVGRRGYVREFSDYAADLARVREHVISATRPAPGQAFYMLGHSMGGLIQMCYALENPHLPVTALVFSSPLFGLSVSVPGIKRMAAVALSALFPRVTLGSELPRDLLSADPDVLAEYERDTLRHSRMSPAAFLGAMAAIRRVESRISQLRHRSLFQIPVTDPICDSAATRRLVEQLDPALGCRIHEYADRRHEIYRDLGREQVFADLARFLEENIALSALADARGATAAVT
jgi:lysophospholipase